MAMNRTAVVRWLVQCMRAGEGGKTLLAGFSQSLPTGAWAAGLRGAADHPDFVVFARYVLQQGVGCDAYWLMLPDSAVGHYRLEVHDGRSVWCGDAHFDNQTWQLSISAQGPWLDDLLAPGKRLPGLMRRELDAMASALRTVTPG